MKKTGLFLVCILVINIVLSQELDIPKTDFNTQTPYSHLIETLSGLDPNKYNGKVKTVSITNNLDYHEIDKYVSYTTQHYFNKKGLRNLTTFHTLEHDCCGKEMENLLDTIYPNLKTKQLDKHTLETINIKDNLFKTTYFIVNKRVKQYTTKQEDIYLSYNKKGDLMSRTGYQVTNEEEKNKTFKYNNFTEKAFYNSRKLTMLTKTYYDHLFNNYGEIKIIFIYDTKGNLIQKTENWKDYTVKGFNPSELLLNQTWSDKKLDSENQTLETFKYNANNQIVTHTYADGESIFEDRIVYYPKYIEIKTLEQTEPEKQFIIEKRLIKLDFNKNPKEVTVLTKDENSNFIEANAETTIIKYEYYK